MREWRNARKKLDPLFRKADDHFDRGVSYARRHWREILVYGTGAGFFLGGVLFLWAGTLQLPDLSTLQEIKTEQSVKLYDRTGEVLLFDLNSDARRTLIPLSAVSPYVQQAVIAIEDPEFYTHKGIKPTAILRAVFTNLLQSELLSGQGGSTITQQVIKLSVLTSDKTITRKLKEWVLAMKLEGAMEKDQILELYLNQAPYGGVIYGVEEASMVFFGKHASDATLLEAAYLAAVLPAPSRLSPYKTDAETGRNQRLEARKNLVLDKMYEHGYITVEQRDEAKAAQVEFLPPRDTSIIAAHFVFYVEEYLEEKYGEEALQRGGWRVITTLDAELQAEAEKIVFKHAMNNVESFNATNMALVGVDPQNGQILTMVGSRNYFDDEIPGAYNVAAASPGRQPGSAFKPFAYAEALRKGYTPETVVFDVRTQFSTACEPTNMTSEGNCYSPGNYDDNFRGPMTLRNALAQSINVPAVKVLYLAGLSDVLRLAKAMGITTLADPARYGLTLVLGGGEVTPLDLTSAYGVFANNGVRYEPSAILRVEDPTGRVIEDNSQPVGSQVLEPYVAEQINDMLSDTVASAPLGLGNFRTFSQDVALKTGTTNDYRDAWIVGYTPNLAVGVWAGNNDNSAMERRTGGLIVAPAWSEFMRFALSKRPVSAFTRSEWPNPNKPVLQGNWSNPGRDGLVHEILYWVDKNNPTGPEPFNPASDPQFEYWDLPVRNVYGAAVGSGSSSGGSEGPLQEIIPPEYFESQNQAPSGTPIIEN